MSFEEYTRVVVPKIEDAVFRQLDKWKKQVWGKSRNLEGLVDCFIEANNGGKRIRGTLAILGYEMVSGSKPDNVLDVAAALEIFQTSILAHDDIIDKSKLRRGKPTIYKALGFDHYALSQTICLGDIGFFIAAQIISESNFPSDIKNKVLMNFCLMMQDTALGEMLDVELPFKGKFKDEAGIKAISLLKTAQYTISGPLKIGAMLAGASSSTLKGISEYGDNVGIAFQVQDDILGAFGKVGEIGKSNTSDFKEGKVTFLSLYAFKHAKNKDLKKLKALYGKSTLSQAECKEIQRIFQESGALDYARTTGVEYAQIAKKAIGKITPKVQYKLYLQELTEMLIHRTK